MKLFWISVCFDVVNQLPSFSERALATIDGTSRVGFVAMDRLVLSQMRLYLESFHARQALVGSNVYLV